MSGKDIEIPDMDMGFSPPNQQKHPELSREFPLHELINDTLARIEVLKMKINGGKYQPNDVNIFMQEFATLRGNVLQVAHLFSRQPHDDLPKVKQNRLDITLINDEAILGQNPDVLRAIDIIGDIAPTDLSVLLEGETGVGKELFARIIHIASQRENFVALNCGALPKELVESELFGHLKGAFTGASSERKGKFEQANYGTIFLDEIGEMDLSLQVKLLRVLEMGELQKLGSDKFSKVDVRVIAATNRDLNKMVDEGTFREDLLYRLNTCSINIPPLRERRDEIPTLLENFINEICVKYNKSPPQLSEELKVFIFERYQYPGNIRELKNIAHYITMIGGAQVVGLGSLPARYRSYFTTSGENLDVSNRTNDVKKARDVAEYQQVIKQLKIHRGKIQKLCESLGVSRSRVYQLLTKYDLKPADFR